MRALGRLLRPTSIAVVGGGAWCESVIASCRESGFAGPIWPVHPTREAIEGLSTFKTIEALPTAPDACFIGVNRRATIDVVQALGRRGAGGAVCFASGFKEALDGKDLQNALLAAAGAMPLLGPNCYGFINALDGAALWPDVHGLRPVERGVAIIGQSSNVLLNLSMQRRGLPIAFLVAAGNQASQGMADIGLDLLEDDRVTALGFHVEGFGDIRAFERLARRADTLEKPIVALKVGRSAAARQATISHTASLAGNDAGAQALIERLGMVRAESLTQLLGILTLLHLHGRRRFARIASLSCSGGEASLIADTGAGGRPLAFPPLTDEQTKVLKNRLGDAVSLANPLDYHTGIWRNFEAMRDVFTAMAADHIDMTCLVLDYPRTDRCDPADWDMTLDALIAAKARSGGAFALIASLHENLPETVADRMITAGVAPLFGFDDALESLAATGTGQAVGKLPILLGGAAGTRVTLSEFQAKRELAAFGLNLPKFFRATSAAEAAARAAEIGFPVVLKGEGNAHKTEAGLVHAGLQSEQDVRTSAESMATDNFLIEAMITDGIAELLIGVIHDPAHGFVLTLGAGGTLAELLDDSASRLIPAARAEVEQAIAKLGIAKLLGGHRGRPSADMAKVLDAVDAVQAYVVENKDRVIEVEVNPLIVTAEDAIAVDALIARTT